MSYPRTRRKAAPVSRRKNDAASVPSPAAAPTPVALASTPITASVPPMLREHEAIVERAVDALRPIAALIHSDAAGLVKAHASHMIKQLLAEGVPPHYTAPVLAQVVIDLLDHNLTRSRALREAGETNPADPASP